MDAVFDPFDVAAAQALHLTAQLEVAADFFVIQNAEAIHNGHGPAVIFTIRSGSRLR